MGAGGDGGGRDLDTAGDGACFAAAKSFCRVYWCTDSSAGRLRVRLSVRAMWMSRSTGRVKVAAADEVSERLRLWEEDVDAAAAMGKWFDCWEEKNCVAILVLCR